MTATGVRHRGVTLVRAAREGLVGVATLILWSVGSAMCYFGFLNVASNLWPVEFSIRFSSDGDYAGATELGIVAVLAGVVCVIVAVTFTRGSRWRVLLGGAGIVAQIAVGVVVVLALTDSRTCSYDGYADMRYCVSTTHAFVRDGLLYVVPAFMAAAFLRP